MPLAEVAAKATAILERFERNECEPRQAEGCAIYDNIESKWSPFTRVREDDDEGEKICQAFIDAGLSFRNYYEELGSSEYGCHIVEGGRNIEVALTEEQIELFEDDDNRFDKMDELLNKIIDDLNNSK
jgi:hypothetical protein